MDPNTIDQIATLIDYIGKAFAAVPVPWAAVAMGVMTAVGAGVHLFARAKAAKEAEAAKEAKPSLPPFGAMTDAEKAVQASVEAADKANAAVKAPK